MKKKIFTLMTLALVSIGTTWAKTVSVTVPTTGWDTSTKPTSHTYQSADKTVSVAFTNLGTGCSATRFEIVKNTTMTITVPTGGLITSLIFTMDGTGSAGNFTYTLTNNTGGGNIFTSKAGDVTFNFPTSVATTATFTFGTDNESKSPYARIKGLVVKYDDGIAETKVATPGFTPEACEFNTSINVTLATDTEEATLLYSTDGETYNAYPDGGLTLTETTTVYAKGTKSGLEDSDVATATYTLVNGEIGNAVSSKYWDFSDWTDGDVKISKTIDDLTIIGTSSTFPTISSGSSSMDGYSFTKQYTTGGGSSETARLIAFKVASNSIITVYCASGNSSSERTINLASATWDNVVASVSTKALTKIQYTYTGTTDKVFYIQSSTNVSIRAIIVEPSAVSVPVGTTGWSTYSSDKILDFGNAEDGIEAYMITGFSGTAVTTSKVTGAVPASTGLLVKGDASTNYSVPVATAADVTTTENKLVAAVTGTTVNAGEGTTVNYVLMNVGGEAVFQWIGSTSATLGANKAYLALDGGPKESASRGLTIDFDGETTGIDSVTRNSLTNGKMYNLQGQEVRNAKGIVIVNGKKVVIK